LQALQQRIAGTCLLRPLSLPETRAYVAERLHAAGLRGSSPFTGTAVENIHRMTNGVPRLINLLSDACLMTGFDLKRKQIDQLIVNQAAEDVLGLVKPTLTVSSPAPVADSEAQSNGNGKAIEPQVEEPVAVATSATSSWPPAISPVHAAVVSDSGSAFAPQAASKRSESSSGAAVAVAEPEERRSAPAAAAKSSRGDARDSGRATKSTFDVLIAALKQNRAVARD
jgi:hypothetical protein